MAEQFNYDKLFSSDSQDAPPGTVRHAKYDFAVAYPDPDTLPLDDLIESVKIKVLNLNDRKKFQLSNVTEIRCDRTFRTRDEPSSKRTPDSGGAGGEESHSAAIR